VLAAANAYATKIMPEVEYPWPLTGKGSSMQCRGADLKYKQLKKGISKPD
jgi:hypothetical protein